MYTVRRLHEQRTVNQPDARVEASNHRAAAALSQLATPGARLIVEGAGVVVRFHVDARGRLVEQSRYAA
ncbi:MAG: hypothetical protein IPO81_00195 [Kouleothrix sp.]|nr:hypothetical protein [Kouleothrix sp.]